MRQPDETARGYLVRRAKAGPLPDPGPRPDSSPLRRRAKSPEAEAVDEAVRGAVEVAVRAATGVRPAATATDDDAVAAILDSVATEAAQDAARLAILRTVMATLIQSHGAPPGSLVRRTPRHNQRQASI